MTRLSISSRLTMVFVVLMALILVGSLGFVHLRVRDSLDRTIDAELGQRWEDLTELEGRAGPGGTPDALAARIIAETDGATQVYARDGRLLATTPSLQDVHLLGRDAAVAAGRRGGGRHLRTVRIDDSSWRVLVGRPASDRQVVVFAVNRKSRNAALRDLAGELLLGGVLVLLVASSVAYGLARRALAPVEQLRLHAAELVARGEEGILVEPGTGDEIARLATTLNELLGRLHDSLRHERQFVADAGHELRTPLALLSAEIELALEAPRTPEQYAETLETLQSETARLVRLAEDLLMVGAAGDRSHPDEVDVAPLVEQVAQRFRARLADSDRDLVVAVEPDLQAEVHADQFDRVVTNLVENAIRHGAGTIEVAARSADPSGVSISVRDHGAGFTEEFVGQAFERFTRADAARSGQGTGLGLAIVAAIVAAHGGTVTAANAVDGGGLVEVRLPGHRR